MISRKFFVRDNVLFDHHNVVEAARHCLPRNLLLQSQAPSAEATAELFVTEISKRMRQERIQIGVMESLYNAWYVVDRLDPKTLLHVPTTDPVDAVTLQVNLFVRPGRKPRLAVVQMSTPDES